MADRVALVAMLGDELIADARYDRWAGKDEAEVAFAVADEHQGRGLSHRSCSSTWPPSPASHGIARFTAEVLPDNRAMLSVFRGPEAGAPRLRRAAWSTSSSTSCPRPTTSNTVDRREQRAESRSIARLLDPALRGGRRRLRRPGVDRPRPDAATC